MQLDAATLLTIWEQHDGSSPVERALALLQAAWPQLGVEEWNEVALGQRDWHLLALRQQLFGEQLEAVAHCPACAEKLETGFALQDICPPGWELEKLRQHLPLPDLQQRPQVTRLACGHRVCLLAPASSDIQAGSGLPVEQAHAALLARCLQISMAPELAAMPAEDQRQQRAQLDLALPALQQAMQEALQELDPLAEIRIELACPACAHQWLLDFDIVSWLWSEISDWVPRLLQQVHYLAAAYGWSEASILAMSARRRRMYLEMVGAAI